MRFICQIRLSEVFAESKSEMAYIFMTEEDDDEFVDGTYDPEGGENAVILQPGQVAIPTSSLSEGPTLYRMVEKPDQYLLQPEPCEFAVTLIVEDEIPFLTDIERSKLSDEEFEATDETLDESKIGGIPVFMQDDDFPFAGINHLLLQLDSCSVPFYINFGDAGVGYAFLNEACDQAKFLWQCG